MKIFNISHDNDFVSHNIIPIKKKFIINIFLIEIFYFAEFLNKIIFNIKYHISLRKYAGISIKCSRK